MLNVGLTGNVAAGKSTVVELFANWGATVIDADQVVREVQSPGSPVMRAIELQFGPEVMDRSGALNRGRLRRIVMGDPAARDALNAIVHPAVHDRRAELMSAAREAGDCVVINDIPLLFEVLDPDQFDAVVLVDAPRAIRRQRLVDHRGYSPDDADDLIASQLPSSEKRGRSDFVIDNETDVDALQQSARTVWRRLRTQAARASAGDGDSLLVVLAHPDDEAFAVGGTLARWAEAGVDIHLACATAGEAGRGNDGETAQLLADLRTQELHRSATILGIRHVHLLGFPDGGLDSSDSQGIASIRALMDHVQPGVCVTFGAEGVTGHPDHVAVHHWVRGARLERTALSYIAYPKDVASRLGVTGCRSTELSARVDIRPWADVKRQSIEAHRSQRSPFTLDDPETSVIFSREWFAGDAPVETLKSDLFGPPSGA